MANGLAAVLSGAAIILTAAACASNDATARAAGAPTATAPAIVYAIVYRAGPRWRPGVPMPEQGLRDHFYYVKGLDNFYYVKGLDNGGRIVAAGQLGPDGGLILLHARDQAEADAVIAADPATVAGIFVGEARPFVPRFVGARSLSPVAP